jgi:hypothetical protein
MRNQLLLIGASLGYDISVLKTIEGGSKSGFKSILPFYGGYIYENGRRWHVKQNICKEIRVDKKNRIRNEKGYFQKEQGKIVNFNYYPKSLVNIEKINEKIRMIDLAVDDELFLINGGLVSHNCNYGSEAIGANWQHFLPKGYWVNGRWVVSENGFSGITPKTPIPAKNYIEKTLAQMQILTPAILKER